MAKFIVPTPETLSAESNHFTDALNEGTDLACALIGCAAIEQALGSLLNKFLVECPESLEILDPIGNNILGPLSARAKVAYCLGLISEKLFANIKVIAKIRNTFAHSRLAFSFTDEEVGNLCMKLTVMEIPTNEEGRHHLNDIMDKSPRSRFAYVAHMVHCRLLLTALGTKHLKKNMIVDLL